MRDAFGSVVSPGRGVKPYRPLPPSPGDIVLVAVVLAVAAALLVSRPGGGTPRSASVQVGGEVVRRLPLDEGVHIEVAGRAGVSEVVVDGGRVRVLDSPCARRICVRRGWLRAVGDVAVCVPNQLVVRVEGEGGPSFDGVSR